MSEQNIPFKKGFFGFKPEKVMDYVDELLRNSDFDQIKISELEKKIASFDEEIAKRDEIILSKDKRISELEAEIETAKNNEAVGVKCTDCDIQKKAEALLGETLFDVKRFSLYLVNDAKKKADTTISEAKGTAGAVSTQAKEILYNVDDISSSFSSQIEELRSSLSGLSTKLDAFCTGISPVADTAVNSDVISEKKPEMHEDKVLSDIKAEIYSELPEDVIEGINSLNSSEKNISEPQINKTAENQISTTEQKPDVDIVNEAVSAFSLSVEAETEDTISDSSEADENTVAEEFIGKESEDNDVSSNESEIQAFEQEQPTFGDYVEPLTEEHNEETDISKEEISINTDERSFIPEPFSLGNNSSFSTSPENQIPVNVIRNGENVMPGMISPFADLFGSEYSVKEDTPSYSDYAPSVEAPAFMPSKSNSELPVFETDKTEKTEKPKDNRERNFTYVNQFKMKPNLNSSDAPVPSDTLPTDFE